MGLKGLTIFRENCARLAILTSGDKKEEEPEEEYEELEHVLQNIKLSSELPKGRNYLMNDVVMEYGFELAEDERDCNIYEYACTLSIPEV